MLALHPTFNIGWRLGGGSRTWEADAADVWIELHAALRQDALPFLTGVGSEQEFARTASLLEKDADPRVQQAIAYALARVGDVEGATPVFNRLLQLLDPSIEWQRTLVAEVSAIRAMLDRDHSAVQRQLDEFEVETRRRLDLEGVP